MQPIVRCRRQGKACSDVASMAEALGRLASLASPLTPKKRLNQIVAQRKGIGGAAFVHEEGYMHCNACGFSQC